MASLVVDGDDGKGDFDNSLDDTLREPSVGLQYEWRTIFHTEPDSHVDRTTLALRFRKRTKLDWFF